MLNAIRCQIGLVLEMEKTLEMIGSLPQAGRMAFNYEAQAAKLEEEIDRCQGLKLRLYEDLSDGVIDKGEYMEFRSRYTDMIAEKKEALDRVKREWKDASVTGIPQRQWAALFKEHENIAGLDRRVLMALVDRVLVHEGHGVEIRFKYRDEFRQAEEYAARFEADLEKAGLKKAPRTQAV